MSLVTGVEFGASNIRLVQLEKVAGKMKLVRKESIFIPKPEDTTDSQTHIVNNIEYKDDLIFQQAVGELPWEHCCGNNSKRRYSVDRVSF